MFSDLVEEGHLFHHIVLDIVDGAVQGLPARDEDVRRVDGDLRRGLHHPAAQRVESLDAFDLIAPEVNPDTFIGIGQVNFNHIPPHPEVAPPRFGVLAAVQGGHQLVQQLVPRDLLALGNFDEGLVEFRRVADAVDAAHARHHDHVPATTEQGACGAQPELLDLVVDRKVLLDVGVGRRQVGLGLVVIVIAHEVLHPVVREEVFELPVKLGGQRLVMAQDQGGLAGPGDHVGHCEGLPGTRDAEQRLGRYTLIDALHELCDGLGLVTGRLEFRDEFE